MPRLRTSPVTLLQAAKKQIATEETWCQGVQARAASGHVAYPASPEAVRWCAEGAYLAVLDDWMLDARRAAWNALSVAALTLSGTVPCVNDELGFAAVHKMYREAIRIAKQENKR